MAAVANRMDIRTLPLGDVQSFRIEDERTLVVDSNGGMGRLGKRTVIAILFPDQSSTFDATKTLITSKFPNITDVEIKMNITLSFSSSEDRDQITPAFFNQFTKVNLKSKQLILFKKPPTNTDFKHPHYIITEDKKLIKNELFSLRDIEFQTIADIRASIPNFDEALKSEESLCLTEFSVAWEKATSGNKPTNAIETETIYNLVQELLNGNLAKSKLGQKTITAAL